ncbi:MAG TPA: hypothetical protein VMT46_19395 [Anaerolineaceae bacterium]|nr:hypothetical protein [Anaerolineaceae bacterium]
MNYLALGSSNGLTVLQGAGMAAPYRGAIYAPKAASDELVEDAIDVALEGSDAQLLAALKDLENKFSQARATWRSQHPRMIWLAFSDTAADAVYLSEVHDGWIEKLKGTRAAGGLALRLHVVRLNRWEFDAGALATVSNDTGGGANRTLQNHTDSTSHENWLEWASSQNPASLPAPITVNLKNTCGSATGEILLGLYDFLGDMVNPCYPWLEGEAASGGSANQASASCSGGYFKPVIWAGAAEAQLLTWNFSTSGGLWRPYRPLIRFGVPNGYSDLCLRIKLLFGSQVVWEGPQCLMSASVDLQELGALELPPALVGWSEQGNLTLGLYGKRAAGGTLNVDYLALVPADSWMRLVPRGLGLATNETLQISSRLGNAAINKGGGAMFSDYVIYGGPLLAKPGLKQRLYVFTKNLAGSAAEIDRTSQVSVSIPNWTRTL